jgi:hypothetical protein
MCLSFLYGLSLKAGGIKKIIVYTQNDKGLLMTDASKYKGQY